MQRIPLEHMFLRIALALAARADCLGRQHGAVIVRDKKILSTGYNGTASGTPNCTDGGCYRCANRERFGSGNAFDLCVCLHAEENALNARQGTLENSEVYVTGVPCAKCASLMYQAGVRTIHYLVETPEVRMKDEGGQQQWERVLSYFKIYKYNRKDVEQEK